MVLVHEAVRNPQQFDEQGYRGTIVPVPGHGSIAVLMRDSGIGGGMDGGCIRYRSRDQCSRAKSRI